MPPQATKDWLSLLRKQAKDRGMYVDTNIDGRIFHFHLGNDPGIIGKVRYSEGKSRDYENKQGQKHIWHRYNRENERIEQGSKRKVVNITLDVRDKHAFDPAEHHFIFLTESLLQEETYSQGDQKIWIEGDGQYSGPLAKYVNDWDAIFKYATNTHPSPTGEDSNGVDEVEGSSAHTNADTSGSILESHRSHVQISDQFKQEVYERYNHRCPLSGIEASEILTISHIVGRSEDPELAEDIENVLLLDWTHHMAFDAGLWTFDESGRLWIKPGFETESEFLNGSLLTQHGEKVDEFAMVADRHIERHNEQVRWWPPR
ncbi:hypothetical protein GOC74_09935 [Halomicrobium mukohataei]|uniref:HNH nuclease domain-containing protein n=1 Tax=Halomicrobium mukohataei TaxID=57705 RepID=A0A847UGM7_9EURY|nr:HNH endonuclease signature motif containing protein [Halomicrobium mukohataei]NLV10248.1 hypothetical protein [Halomicrobium mukohataei]